MSISGIATISCFADLLHKSLNQNYPVEVPELHLRASQWFEQNEYPHQAVEHAFIACDYPRAARLLEEVAEPVLGRGEHIWLLRWIEKLPEDQMEAHLRLSIVRAAILVSTGLVQAAEEALQRIEAHLQSQALDPAGSGLCGWKSRCSACHDRYPTGRRG